MSFGGLRAIVSEIRQRALIQPARGQQTFPNHRIIVQRPE